MRTTIPRLVLLAALWAAPFPARSNELIELHCHKSHAFLAPADSSQFRKYAPDRLVDILHLAIDVTPDFQARTVQGTTTLTFKPIAKPLPELRLHAVDLAIQELTASVPIQAYQVTGEEIIVTFEAPIAAEQEARLTVTHSAEPAQGLYFRTPAMGYKEGETHLFTQGEPVEARHWYPCYDFPNEKFTSEVTCRVPEGMTVLSNGQLISEEKDPETGLVAVRWRQEKPHVNYLISLVAGYFKKIEDQYQGIPLAFYTLPSEIDQAIHSFRDTKEMMDFFIQEIGVAYPWSKYYQVCVNDFVAGGMENTSVTTLTDRTLFTAASENIRSSENLVAHELAHQWFGNLVTCKDWSHLWLNEGFATYYAHLFAGRKHGRDEMLYGLYTDAQGFLDRPNDTKPIVDRGFDSPMEQFSYLTYPKGSWVLHMLRSQLGEELFRQCAKTFLDRHAYDTAVTEDLNEIIEELSGRSFDQFFDQWVYHAHHPELDIQYSWDAQAKLAKLSISQTQKLGPTVLLFNFPAKIRFKTASQTVDRAIQIKEKAEDFYFPLPEAPRLARFDPDFSILAKVKFPLPDTMVHAQLEDKSDVIGRLIAVEQLSSKKTAAAAAKLGQALQQDPFYGVRIAAAKALRDMHTDESFAALTNGLVQSDARVRQQVAMAIGAFYREEAFAASQRLLKTEKNPEILAQIIQSLAPYAKPGIQEILIQYVQSDSYRNTLADAAVRAMRAQENPAYLKPLLQAVRARSAEFTTWGLAGALNAAAYLARHEEDKEEVRELLAEYVRHPKKNVQRAALGALGALGDARAIPLLQTFASAGRPSPEREAAEKAIGAIRSAKAPQDDFRDLRNEVLELQKQNRDLRKEFDALKKRFDAMAREKSLPETSAPSRTPIRPGKRRGP